MVHFFIIINKNFTEYSSNVNLLLNNYRNKYILTVSSKKIIKNFFFYIELTLAPLKKLLWMRLTVGIERYDWIALKLIKPLYVYLTLLRKSKNVSGAADYFHPLGVIAISGEGHITLRCTSTCTRSQQGHVSSSQCCATSVLSTGYPHFHFLYPM